MRVFYNSFTLFTRRLLRPDNHACLASRYFTKLVRSRDNPQLNYLKSVIENNESDWKVIKDNILSKEGSITETNIDSIMLKFIISQKKFNSAYSFADYLKTSSGDLNLGATNSLLNLYFESAMIKQPSDEVRQFILSSYKRLYDKYKALDYFTSERLLRALCVIDEWKLSLKILDDIHLSSTPSHSTYSVLIATLFRNNEESEALKIVQRSFANCRPLQDYAYDEWFKYILRNCKDIKSKEKKLEVVCCCLAENYIKLSEETAERIRDTFASLNWSAEYTSIKQASGECVRCQHTLNNIELTSEEFLLLQQNVKEKLIVGSDLFLKTSPTELERFLKFIDRTKPYDIVLDGLNIAYAIGKGTYIDKLQALNIVVDYFLKQKKKVLLLGRRHMFKWPGPILRDLSRKTYSFFTEDLTQDDPYFITAAILSGAKTDIVSRDLLRGHRFLMKQEHLRLLFRRWQWQHQWMIYIRGKRPIVQYPLTFTPSAQKHESGWHIPYEKVVETEENYFNDGGPDCSAWLCIKKKDDVK